MSSSTVVLYPLTCIPFGISSEYENHFTGISMRKVPTYVGATTGNNGRTEGLPEVQESVLEHAAPETQNAQVTGKTLSQNSDVVKLVTNVTEVRKTDNIGKVQHCSVWRTGGPNGNPPARRIWAADLIEGSELYDLFPKPDKSSFWEKWTSVSSTTGAPQ